VGFGLGQRKQGRRQFVLLGNEGTLSDVSQALGGGIVVAKSKGSVTLMECTAM
jgi:hypothetical protein